jgi:hypothetical protein
LHTSRIRLKNITNRFGVAIDSISSRVKVSTVTFHEYSVFCPIIVFISCFPRWFESVIIWSMRVKNSAISVR